MTKQLHISPDLSLPLDAVTQTFVVYGGKGMGKTNFASVVAEELDRAHLRFSLIDPLGVSWGLQSSADGKSGGIEVLVLGGIHGDIPIDPSAGAIVADLVVDESISVVVDISRHANGRMWTMGEKIRFVTDYCIRLYERQGEKRVPLMQMFDEAGRFIPQVIPHGAVDIAKCVGAIDQLTEWGRNVGVGILLITQRSARMNKSVSELADMMIAFRTVGPHSLKAIDDWLSENIEKERRGAIMNEIRRLPVGQAMVVSPGWLDIEKVVRVRMRTTFDSSATPKAGVQMRTPAKRAEINIDQYRQRMAETIERAVADDPKELRRQITDLKKQLQSRPAAKPEVERVEVRVEVPVIADEQLDSLRDITRNLLEIAATAEGVSKDISAALMKARGQQQALASIPPIAQRPAAPPLAKAPPAKASVPTVEGITEKEQRILNALGTFAAAGLTSVNKANLAAVSGISPRSSELGKAYAHLRVAGLIKYNSEGGKAMLTDKGVQHVRPDARLSSRAELHQAWLKVLNTKEGRVMSVLITHFPKPITKEDLAQQAGISLTSSEFGKVLASLRALEIADYPQPGYVGATELLFPAALK